MAIEYNQDDVHRKFNKTVCLVEIIPKKVKGFFYIRENDDGFELFDSKNNQYGPFTYEELKFTYHRFSSGWYPAGNVGAIRVIRKAANRVYTMGLNTNSHYILGLTQAGYSELSLFQKLEGTFDSPIYHKFSPDKKYGALSLMFAWYGDSLLDIFGNEVGRIDRLTKTVFKIKETQELIDIVNRSFPHDWEIK